MEVNSAPVITDDEGIARYEWLGVFQTHGRLSILRVDEAQLWEGQRVEASLRLPLGTNVAPGSRVKARNQDWTVVTARPNAAHLRAMLRRAE